MDGLIEAAAHALARGDALGALQCVALRDDAAALALRGTALAQLGDLGHAKALLRRAASAFGAKQSLARARCVLAEAEIALASRDLHGPAKALAAVQATLVAHGDRANAAYARHFDIRRLILIGRLAEAERRSAAFDPAALPPALRAVHELALAEIALRQVRAQAAHAALERAARAARESGIPALRAEVDTAALALTAPAARLIVQGAQRPLRLGEVEALLESRAVVVDACRHAVRSADSVVTLATRPVLFALARALAEAWPDDVPRDQLIAQAFRTRYADATHRARLRVEIGRMRQALRTLLDVNATRRGFAFAPREPQRSLVVLAPPVEERHAAVLALLGDGESWASSALALALGTSQRSVQRALDALAGGDKVQAVGSGRARRWMTPPTPGFATVLLLPAPLPQA